MGTHAIAIAAVTRTAHHTMAKRKELDDFIVDDEEGDEAYESGDAAEEEEELSDDGDSDDKASKGKGKKVTKVKAKPASSSAVKADKSRSAPQKPAKKAKVVDTDDDEAPSPPARSKAESQSQSTSTPSNSEWTEAKDGAGVYITLAKNRRLAVSSFKGHTFVDIRETYQDKTGEMAPGKKGISLNPEAWKKFKSLIADVDEQLAKIEEKGSK